jgi:hypothetical protein
MPLNDDTGGDFSSTIEDETTYPDNASMRGLEHDAGSGSYAEDGRRELAENVVLDGGRQLGTDHRGVMMLPPLAYSAVGSAQWAAMFDQSEIGSGAMYGPSEIGSNAMYGPSEIGSNAMYGPSEIGGGAGWAAMFDQSEIGGYGLSSIKDDGVMAAGAARAVIKQARDSRVPSPPLKALPPESPFTNVDDTGLVSVLVGLAEVADTNPFPLLTEFMKRAGASHEPRYIRVDSEASYKGFRAESSPELSDLAHRMSSLETAMSEHADDPDAHASLSSEMEDLAEVGAEAAQAEEEKKVDMYMPRHTDGLVSAWREGDLIYSSMAVPAVGHVRVCTGAEPIGKCLSEISEHAADSGVPPSAIVGMLPAMGHVLGAANVLKDVACGAKSISKIEAPLPFIVRLEPKLSPALAGLGMLALACFAGNAQACAEWAALGAIAPAPIKQAMQEAVSLAKVA